MTAVVHTMDSRLQRIRKLTEVSRAVSYAASLDHVFQLTVDHAAELLAAEKSVLMVANDDGLLALRSSHGIDAEIARRFHEPLNEALVPRLAGLLDAQAETFLGVPLVVDGAIKGVLVVIRPAKATSEEHDEWLLSALADQAAVALEKARLDELGTSRERLIGIVAHDLRSPLTTILAGARLLVTRQGLAEGDVELARKITSSALVAAHLIAQMLDLTRSRLGGGIPIDPGRCDIKDVCRQVADETQLTHPETQLRVEVSGDSIGIWDRDRAYQLLANLIGNAVQHGEKGSSVELRVHGEARDEIVLEVANRGAPIAPAMLPFIFDAFRHGRTSHPSRKSGLGLGLYIAQQIALAHGGSIGVTSSETEGTCFRVRLPRAVAAA